jgi:hypothetical protein
MTNRQMAAGSSPKRFDKSRNADQPSGRAKGIDI